MKHRSTLLIYFLLFFIIAGPACSMSQRIAAALKSPTPVHHRRLVVLPPAPANSVHDKASQPQGQAILPTLAAELAAPVPVNLVGAFGQATAAAPLPVSPVQPAVATPAAYSIPAPTATPLPTNTPVPPQPPAPVVVSLPTATPPPTSTPTPAYDFTLAEFYNSPTTNSFLMVYVAVVDPNDVPIGDMKVVGTRQDHNLTYESPLSKWFYEGYSAPGEVIKSGNMKFEPPGGIETTSWVLHLEDTHSNRQSADIPFDVDANNKQWYFIKLRRNF